MSRHHSFGTQVRLDRLNLRGDGKLMIVPLDHSVADGPITPGRPLDSLVGELTEAGVDAIVLHKGTARHVRPSRFTTTSLIVHLSASTAHAPDPDAKYMVADVEAALRLSADAVSVHVNMGSREEARQIADLAWVAEACDRWNVPLLAMMYARGPAIENGADPALVTHSATLAADLGADIVKITYPGSPQNLAEVVRACPIPVVVAGGASTGGREQVLDLASVAMRSGTAGLAVGRNIFHAAHPGEIAREITDRIHGRATAAA
ncbi:2-amino-3,7-dideoxy-D-threo-hept-6-ulosonate synthase [Actinokineospora spheciospongiae]|uniref:2-amino-3,7-dideoxy-D-threo-hept-6-ulosonate synthase n=1 Tax=Actinokineospora spheciospongiae TaxID=909613 RepID=UPI000D7177D1|nr:2-amino-3,7-dideoxy-D-threo-hept-6-ulosonate synthase [Actinokineospora spheciospongiae]PWW55549.1 2-amino-4,5-dihydroxy-6-oxo-7-(phosphonooxy)heptanoate synthase [Actinokineospora spheciospongiae]